MTYSRSHESGARISGASGEAPLELPQQPRIVAPEQAEIGDPVPQDGDAFEPPAEGEARVSLGVVSDELEQVGVDHSRATHLDPAGVATDRAARPVAEVARDERLDRRLGEREVMRDEAGLPALAEERLQQIVERSLQVSERDAFVDGEGPRPGGRSEKCVASGVSRRYTRPRETM